MRINIFVRFFCILIAILSVFTFAHAEMHVISDKHMGSISGQAGIQILFYNAGIKMSADTIYYGDEDGVNDQKPAYLTLCNVGLEGEIYSSTPLKIDLGVAGDFFNPSQKIENVMIQLQDMTLHINNFKIDAIKVGPEVGEGKSFGSYGVGEMHIEITGNPSLIIRGKN